jgi:hypothetical protein
VRFDLGAWVAQNFPNFSWFINPLLAVSIIVLAWLVLAAGMGVLTGWFGLPTKFPDRAEEPLLQLRGLSVSMGLWANMWFLTLSVCPSGLRVEIPQLIGLFCRNFFVPWENLRVFKRKGLLGQAAELRFGNPMIGSLAISWGAVEQLATAAIGRWPETQSSSPQP